MASESYREELVRVSRGGEITLVLGAGVSRSYGLPDWEGLARRAWEQTFPQDEAPWTPRPGEAGAQVLPQFLPIVFERVYRKLGAGKFAAMLAKCLYRDVDPPGCDAIAQSPTTLAVLARLLLREHRAGAAGRIRRVITLNADDLLEEAVQTLARDDERPVTRVGSSLDRPQRSGRGGRRPIPVYHLHGIVPVGGPLFRWIFSAKLLDAKKSAESRQTQLEKWQSAYEHALVFTDTQYWRSASEPLSFPNRTMIAALDDSTCIFIGMSMSDINVLRWLAVRQSEIERTRDATNDALFNLEPGADGLTKLMSRLGKFAGTWSATNSLNSHFWIRPADSAATQFLSEFLAQRGIQPVTIGPWTGPDFAELIGKCFPQIAFSARPVRRRKPGKNPET